MTADCAFKIGYGHGICQDYGIARSGETARVILADGCSSSPDTDIGARLLVRTADQLLRGADRDTAEGQRTPLPLPFPEAAMPGEEGAGFHGRVVRAATEIAERLGLDPRCLDATLLTLSAGQGQWTATLYGDGVLAVGERTGRVRITSLTYPAGYPDYPSYLADPDRRQAFQALDGNQRRIEAYTLSPGGEGKAGRCVGTGCYVESGPVAEAAWIAVLTDGVHSLSGTGPEDAGRERIPLLDVLAELLAFRSWRGVFVQRRLQRFLKECETRSWRHSDDLSLGAIAFL